MSYHLTGKQRVFASVITVSILKSTWGEDNLFFYVAGEYVIKILHVHCSWAFPEGCENMPETHPEHSTKS